MTNPGIGAAAATGHPEADTAPAEQLVMTEAAKQPSLTTVHDAIHVNVDKLPAGQSAGYTTGSADIKWSAANWAAHPVAVRIDQDAAASDTTADVLDVERGAASPGDAPGWVRQARAAIAAKKRTGQRQPMIYMSASEITGVVNALISGGVKSGVDLWVAHYGIGEAEAADMINTGGGPFPIKAVQYTNGPSFDTSLFDPAWLANTVDNSDWIRLPGIPANASVYYNHKRQTLGYNNLNGKWTRVHLPS